VLTYLVVETELQKIAQALEEVCASGFGELRVVVQNGKILDIVVSKRERVADGRTEAAQRSLSWKSTDTPSAS
jgi:hypothetical protein